MNLLELQKVLGDRISVSIDSSLTNEEKRVEIETSQTICKIAKQMINNADIILRADKLESEGKIKDSSITQIVKG